MSRTKCMGIVKSERPVPPGKASTRHEMQHELEYTHTQCEHADTPRPAVRYLLHLATVLCPINLHAILSLLVFVDFNIVNRPPASSFQADPDAFRRLPSLQPTRNGKDLVDGLPRTLHKYLIFRASLRRRRSILPIQAFNRSS